MPSLQRGGLLLLDNVLLCGEVVTPRDDRTRTMDDLNRRISQDDRVDSVMTLVADGLTLARRRKFRSAQAGESTASWRRLA